MEEAACARIVRSIGQVVVLSEEVRLEMDG